MRKRILVGILVGLLLIVCWHTVNLALPLLAEIRDNLLPILEGSYPMPELADNVFYLLIALCFLVAILIPSLKSGKGKDDDNDGED